MWVLCCYLPHGKIGGSLENWNLKIGAYLRFMGCDLSFVIYYLRIELAILTLSHEGGTNHTTPDSDTFRSRNHALPMGNW